MTYTGPETDINYGSKIADKYGLLTNNGLETLKRHGNLLVSLEKYDVTLINIAKMEFDEDLTDFRKRRPSNERIILIGKASKELKKEILRLTGFKNINIRRLEPDVKGDPVCLIIERSEDGDQDGE